MFIIVHCTVIMTVLTMLFLICKQSNVLCLHFLLIFKWAHRNAHSTEEYSIFSAVNKQVFTSPYFFKHKSKRKRQRNDQIDLMGSNSLKG